MKTTRTTNAKKATVTSITKFAANIANNAYSIWGKRIAVIPVELLEIDDSYQRVLSGNIKKLMEEWDNDKCDFLLVSYRDGKYYIIDGQHRHIVAKMKEIPDLPCIILTGLTREDEALLFARQHRNVTKLINHDTYKANIINGDMSIPEVRVDMEIKRICEKYNISIKKNPTKKELKVLRCLSRARLIVKSENGSECFDWILSIINRSNWETCPEAYTREIVCMLKNYYTKNVSNLETSELPLIHIMNTTTPAELISMAKYEFSEYTVTTALNLCLKILLTESRTI